MDITINGKKAGIVLEGEKTVEDLLRGLDSWLEGMGQHLSGIDIDGAGCGLSALEKVLPLQLDTVSRVDIKTSSWPELMLEALLGIKNDLEYFVREKTPEKAAERSEWETTYAAEFLRQNAPDIYGLVLQILDGQFSYEAALSLINERIREVQDPREELKLSIPFITETAKRLEDFPLDIQTGKEARAAETIALFSGAAEKLFRLLFFLQRRGLDTGSIKSFLDEFGSTVRELQSAYENRDIVLAGDLAEYELAPRLLEFASRLDALTFPAEVSS